MRSLIKVTVKVPMPVVNMGHVAKPRKAVQAWKNMFLDNFGVEVNKDGFIGFAEDLDYFFTATGFTGTNFEQAFNAGKNKWADGDISYLN